MINRNSSRGDGLAVGTAVVDITPPVEVGLLMSSIEGRWQPFDGVRKPLYARALILESDTLSRSSGQRERAAIISLDMLALAGEALGGFLRFKQEICREAGDLITAENLVLVCTHTHTAPESGAITGLHCTAAFKKWIALVQRLLSEAVVAAVESLEPCRVAFGSSTAKGLGIHRRYKTTSGIMMSYPEPPEETVLSREGPVDDSVNVVTFYRVDDRPIAILTNATCHPVYEMCNPQISPDYPGELCSLLEQEFPGAMAIFLNGASGNINPIGVSAGAVAAKKHAERLVEAVREAVAGAESLSSPRLVMQRRSIALPTRLPDGINTGKVLNADIVGLAIGEVAFIFLPGEPFVETGLALRRQSPFECTIVAGFSEETVGYIPTDDAFSEGGYETGFGAWSVLAPTSETAVRREATQLIGELQAQASAESFERAVPVPHTFGPRSKPAVNSLNAMRPDS